MDSLPVVPLIFHCTVCNGEFNCENSWLRHLLETRHRELAKINLLNNWTLQNTRESFIVVYSKQSVLNDDRILQYFSNDTWTAIVTDFVWWAERPGIGFIQFESGETVKAVLKSIKDSPLLLIESKEFQIREGESFSDFEWDDLLPQVVERSENGVNSKFFSKEGDDEVTVIYDSSTCPSDANKSSGPSSSPPVLLIDISFEEGEQQPTHCSFLQDREKRKEVFDLLLDFIQKEVVIPDDEYNAALNLVCHVNHIFSSTNKTSKPKPVKQMYAFLMRNWTFKLQFHPANYKVPSIYVINKKNKKIDNTVYRQLLHHTIPSFRPYTKSNPKDSSMPNSKFNSRFSVLYQSKSNLTLFPNLFFLFGNGALAVEAQMWRLAKYLSSFDSRCEILMQIIFYWANLNLLRVGIPNVILNAKLANYSPGPATLIWMVIFFLCNKKVIPTPGMVLEQVHKPLFYNKHNSVKIDIGFEENPTFKKIWENDFTRSHHESQVNEDVFPLVIEMFCFWGKFVEGDWVINTKKGTFCQTQSFGNPSDRDQVKDWRNLLQGNIQRRRKFKLQDNIYMTNPFCPAWNILIAKGALEHFKNTGLKLQTFLGELLRNDNEFDVSNFSSDYVQNLFKI